MSKTLFFEEMDMVLDGIINAPRTIIKHLLLHEDATLERLAGLFEEEDQRFVEGWIRRMMDNLAVVRFYYPVKDISTYELSPFARDMINHIRKFRVTHKGREGGE